MQEFQGHISESDEMDRGLDAEVNREKYGKAEVAAANHALKEGREVTLRRTR